MEKNIGRYIPAHPHVGKLVESLSRPLVRAVGATLKFYDNNSRYARLKGQEMLQRLSRGQSIYLLGAKCQYIGNPDVPIHRLPLILVFVPTHRLP